MARVTALVILFVCLVAPLASVAAAPSHVSAILLLDKSGSMKKTDPDCIRCEAIDLLLELMQNQDRAALYTFGTDVQDLSNGLVTLTEKENRRLTDVSGRCVARDAHTDILAALTVAESAVSALGEAARQAYPPCVIILTDGVDDVANPSAQRTGEINSTLNSLAMLGARIFAVGLSGGADRVLLQRMKDVTNGEVVFVNEPRDLLGGFFGLSRELGNRWLLWEGGVSGQSHSIKLPEWVKEVTAVFVPDRPGISGLLAVSGATAGLVADHYQVIKFTRGSQGTVLFELPNGPGKLIIDGAGDLVLNASVPPRVPRGIPFQVIVEVHAGRDQALSPAMFLERQVAEITLTDFDGRTESVFLYDDGMHEDQGPADGVFGGRMVVNLDDPVNFSAIVKAPFSRALRAQGKLAVVGKPTEIKGSSPLNNITAGWGKPLEWRVENITDVPLPARADFTNGGEVVQTEKLIVPANDSVVFQRKFQSDLVSPTIAGVDIYLGDESDPVYSEERTVWPKLWVPLAALLLLLSIIATAFLPRRSANGSLLTIYYYDEEDADPTGATAQLTGNGPVLGIDIPAPFDDPGSFAARSGLWRKGIAFIPAPGMTPKFHGRKPRRDGAAYIIDRTATWTTSHGDKSAKYHLRANRS